jgi:hypothetical protein
MNRPILNFEIKLLLYCINVNDKNEDSANILFFMWRAAGDRTERGDADECRRYSRILCQSAR